MIKIRYAIGAVFGLLCIGVFLLGQKSHRIPEGFVPRYYLEEQKVSYRYINSRGHELIAGPTKLQNFPNLSEVEKFKGRKHRFHVEAKTDKPYDYPIALAVWCNGKLELVSMRKTGERSWISAPFLFVGDIGSDNFESTTWAGIKLCSVHHFAKRVVSTHDFDGAGKRFSAQSTAGDASENLAR